MRHLRFSSVARRWENGVLICVLCIEAYAMYTCSDRKVRVPFPVRDHVDACKAKFMHSGRRAGIKEMPVAEHVHCLYF